MEELGEGDEFRIIYCSFFIFGQSSVLSAYNNESVNIHTDLQSYSGPVCTFCSFFTRTVCRTERQDVKIYFSLGVSDFFFLFLEARLMNLFPRFSVKKGEYNKA